MARFPQTRDLFNRRVAAQHRMQQSAERACARFVRLISFGRSSTLAVSEIQTPTMRHLLVAAMIAVACGPAVARDTARACPSGWRSAQAADGAIALCTPPEFQLHPDGPTRTARWRRGQPGDVNFAMLSAALLDSADVIREWGTTDAGIWPLESVADSTKPDAVESERLSVDSVSIDEHPVVLETALLSGGAAGMRRQPYLRARWQVAPNRWVLVGGLSADTADLTMLRAIVRTLHIATSRATRRATRYRYLEQPRAVLLRAACGRNLVGCPRSSRLSVRPRHAFS